MISGGHVVVYVSDMNRAVEFYTTVLRLTLAARYGDHYAQVDAGKGLTLGLHPAGPESPKPGSRGAVLVTFGVTDAIEREVDALKARGVSFAGPVRNDDPVKLAYFADPDGNPLCLCESRRGW